MSDSEDEPKDEAEPKAFVVEYDAAGEPTNLPQYIYKKGTKGKFIAQFNRRGPHWSKPNKDIDWLLNWIKKKNEELDAKNVPPARAQAERTQAKFQSDVDGVNYVGRLKKWQGSVYDKFLKKNIPVKPTCVFEDKAECEAAVTKLRAEMDERFEAEITKRIVENVDKSLADLPRAPTDKTEAEIGTVYCHVESHSNYEPYRTLVQSDKKGYHRACESCNQNAQPNEKGDTATHCIKHGGGPRCQMDDMHIADDMAPWAGWDQIVSTSASLRIDGNDILQPQYFGKRACTACLRQVDPSNPIVKQQIRGEYIIIEMLMSILFKIPEVSKMLGKSEADWKYDCATGLSKRRPDLIIKVPLPDGRTFIIIFENDENGHADRTTSCENSKIAGHFIDFGATWFSQAEGDAVDIEDEVVAAMAPVEREKIEALRKTAMQNIQRRIRSQDRVADGVLCPNVHVLRLNQDAFLDPETGVVHKSLIVKKKLTGGKPVDDNPENRRKELSKDAEKELGKVAERIRQLVVSAKAPEWIKTKKELEIEYFRYGDKEFLVKRAEAAKAAFIENAKKRKRELGAGSGSTGTDGTAGSSSSSSNSGGEAGPSSA